MGCVAVEVDGKRAPVFYVSPGQINAQAPILEAGQREVRVISNPGTSAEQRSESFRVQVSQQAPRLFTIDGRTAVAHRQDGSLVNAQAPARPGEVIVVYGSGFGYTEPVFQPGEFAFGNPVLRGVTVTLGGRPVTDVLFSGLSEVAPGLYRFDWRVPADTPDGDAALERAAAASPETPLPLHRPGNPASAARCSTRSPAAVPPRLTSSRTPAAP
jgi:uncharacterized protein (TIGR03437 family)